MLTLHYLALRARGEPIKMMLHFGGIQFRDHVISFKDWPKYKADPNICPFGQVPSLELSNGTAIVQSGAIARYVAKMVNIYPDDMERAATSDMLYELSQEMNMINPITNWFEYGSDKWTSEKENYFKLLPARLDFIQRMMGSKPFLAGNNYDNKPSHADFGLFHILDLTVTVEPTSLDGHPALLEWLRRMRAIPAIGAYLQTRPGPGTEDWGRPGSFILSTTGSS